ncbi:1-acyl-sn-glycerol-3-phosphate acyltransferase [Algoriphagus sp.]|uniref:lysophospholipid acyltransferase family protein n=1 Tax=Algoriphagus sp. TaxID=1872435 RepID=UPI0025F49907|nr:lysophospholipid acyltransferase family protein [Algoriphagus sp.]
MKIIQAIFTIYSLLIFIVLMLVFGLFIVLPVLFSDRAGVVSFFFIRLWAGIWCFLSGFRFEIHGREHIDQNQPYIYIFNHRSFFDAPIIPIAIPQQVRALGKKELSTIPFFGWVVGKFAIWVNRDNPESRKESIPKLIKILEKGISIVVAPEGTRNDTDDLLLPFRKGAFRLSVETGIPILPFAIIGADTIHKRGSFLLSPGKVQIYFSQPILPSLESTVEEFAEKCRNRLKTIILSH